MTINLETLERFFAQLRELLEENEELRFKAKALDEENERLRRGGLMVVNESLVERAADANEGEAS